MYTESCPRKLSGELDASSGPNDNSTLEDDLALSSSTLGLQDKTLQESASEATSRLFERSERLIYVNEDTMDCSYAESTGTPKNHNVTTDVSSPEMFATDDEDDDKNSAKDSTVNDNSRYGGESGNLSLMEESTKETESELIARSDCYLLARINKFLTGVPPPPKHTISQRDCADLLASIIENREYFLVDPLKSPARRDTDEETTSMGKNTQTSVFQSCFSNSNVQNDSENQNSVNNDKSQRGINGLRNLTNAFDACEQKDDTGSSLIDKNTVENGSQDSKELFEKSASDEKLNEIAKKQTEDISAGSQDSSTRSNVANSEISANREKEKRVTFKMTCEQPTRIPDTIGVQDAEILPWDVAYKHKTHGIHYNRSKIVEDFESLTLKLCHRYIGAETQSTCNIWFTKQTPASVKKRNPLMRRNSGQSPGKRLSHLARRRRTFSSANLQGLGMVDKKQLILNIKKPLIRKGKSPRGKSPRGSAKKRLGLSRVSPSPRKTKLETSKRALFQSPPGERPGPSRASLGVANPQRIKRALFPTSKTKDDAKVATITTANASEIKKVLNFEETKKRKNEEELEGPRFKWAKSLSFDCAHPTDSNSSDSWTLERHSTGNFHVKSDNSMQSGKPELSETHRKKLLWAVAEALRGKGISMGHPRFKQCASQLARTVKKYMPDLENPNMQRKPGSTSDRMLRLAKRHVLLIVESKSAE